MTATFRFAQRADLPRIVAIYNESIPAHQATARFSDFGSTTGVVALWSGVRRPPFFLKSCIIKLM